MSQPDFLPTAPWPNLRRRAELLATLRAYFAERGFLEVETPVLSADTVVDRHLDPFATELTAEPEHAPRRLYLQTSPEFGMKRLLAAGAGPIYQVSRVFRQGERGRLHNPEFTLVEWYRPGDDMTRGMQLTSDLAEALLRRGPAERLSYREAFVRHVGVDPHAVDVAQLRRLAADRGIAAPATLGDDRDAWLDLLLTELVQPHLGVGTPALLYHYPASQAALARIGDDGGTPVAERFELYADGIELANGYHELLDAAELRRRNAAVNAQRQADGKPALPEESRLLAAMESGLPPATGVALGFDRLVMVALGVSDIREVIAFPVDRA